MNSKIVEHTIDLQRTPLVIEVEAQPDGRLKCFVPGSFAYIRPGERLHIEIQPSPLMEKPQPPMMVCATTWRKDA